jgi:hypothetical protein
MVRIASRIGIQRIARDVTPPSVQEYLAHKAAKHNKEATDDASGAGLSEAQ